jgi:hypothetical protein
MWRLQKSAWTQVLELAALKLLHWMGDASLRGQT